jgi:hypothetical protein
VIAAQNRSKPDADTFLDLNIAQQYGCGSNENIPGNLRFLPIVFNDHKSSPFFRTSVPGIGWTLYGFWTSCEQPSHPT